MSLLPRPANSMGLRPLQLPTSMSAGMGLSPLPTGGLVGCHPPMLVATQLLPPCLEDGTSSIDLGRQNTLT